MISFQLVSIEGVNERSWDGVGPGRWNDFKLYFKLFIDYNFFFCLIDPSNKASEKRPYCKTEWLWESLTWSHKMNFLDIYQLLLTTSIGNEQRQQMRIQSLILGFKGLSLYSKTRNITMNGMKINDSFKKDLEGV